MDICIRCGNPIEDEDPSYDAEMYILELSQDNIKCQLEEQLCATCAKQYERRLKKRTHNMNPRPESRIKALEGRTSDLEATLVELSSDTAEELRVIRQEIKQGHMDIGKALDSHADGLMQEIRKQDTRFDKIEGDIAELKGLIMQLLQQKSE